MFFDCTVQPESKENKLGSSNQEACSTVGKNTGKFSAMLPMEVCPLQLFPKV